MLKNALLSGAVLIVLAPQSVAAAGAPAPSAKLAASQVVEKNIAAKGGLQAWHSVQSMSFSGNMEAGGKNNTQLPFWMELKRPHKLRVEIEFAKDRAIQVYDGNDGWKLRPFLGRNEVEPFKPDELQSAAMDSELDGPLVDYALKGTTVTLEGVEKVEGHDAYKLKLTTKEDQVRHLWIDAKSFLEVKIEGVPRRMDGKLHPVEVYYRDYRSEGGLMMAHVLETAVQGYKQTHKMYIDKVVVNPNLEDSIFTKASLLLPPGAPQQPAGSQAPVGGTAKPAAGSSR